MKTFTFPKALFLLTALLSFSAITPGQATPAAGAAKNARFGPEGRSKGPRPNLLRELGLDRDQIESIKLINQERKPAEMVARRRFQNANRALNMAIYADLVDEDQFSIKLSEFQAAQAELARIKFSNELAIRRLLTPAQLTRFRELRRRFAEEREEMRDDDGPPDGRGFPRARRPLRRPLN